MPRYSRTTVDRLRVAVDIDGNVGVLGVADNADHVILSLGKAVRNGSGWHAFPMNDDGTLWTTPCYLRTRGAAIRYMAAFTAYGNRIDRTKIR